MLDAAAFSEPRRPLVVVADDNRDAADSLAELLRLEGFEVSTAYDGLAALELVLDVRPCVAVLDINMPHLDGDKVAQLLHDRNVAPDVVLIAVTGRCSPAALSRLRGVGFAACFAKPVEFETLFGSIVAQGGTRAREVLAGQAGAAVGSP